MHEIDLRQTVRSVAEALENEYDLILLDVMLPVCQELRADDKREERCPIIMLTAKGEWG